MCHRSVIHFRAMKILKPISGPIAGGRITPPQPRSCAEFLVTNAHLHRSAPVMLSAHYARSCWFFARFCLKSHVPLCQIQQSGISHFSPRQEPGSQPTGRPHLSDKRFPQLNSTCDTAEPPRKRTTFVKSHKPKADQSRTKAHRSPTGPKACRSRAPYADSPANHRPWRQQAKPATSPGGKKSWRSPVLSAASNEQRAPPQSHI